MFWEPNEGGRKQAGAWMVCFQAATLVWGHTGTRGSGGRPVLSASSLGSPPSIRGGNGLPGETKPAVLLNLQENTQLKL